MSVIGNNILAGASGQATGYDIEQSLRFEDGDTPYLSWTPGSAGNRKTWTWSGWIKHSTVGSDYWENVFGAKTDVNNYAYIVFEADVLRFFNYVSSSANGSTSTSDPKYRDPSAWRHVVIAWDTTQATDTNRLKIYINGEQLTLPATVSYPTLNHDGVINNATPHYIGGQINGEFDGYLAEMHFIDGQALTPASFGETNSATNQWVPIEVTGMTYGTNGFYQKYSATELAASFTDSGKSAIDSSDRESEITVTSSFTWLFTSSGNTDGEDLVNGLVTNNDAGGGWMPSGDVTDRWIKFDFGSGKVYTRCQWISINSSASEGTWKWQGSNNDSDWTDIGGTFTLGGADGGSNVTYTLGDTLSGNTTSYRYYRILGTTGSANTNGRRLAMYFGGWSDGVGHTITANGDVANARGDNLGTTYTQIDSFTSTGSSTWTCPSGVTSIEVLTVAGGAGGGGYYYGGGGGAGGVVHDATYSVTAGVVYDITVGAGGAADTAGGNSVFNVNAEGSGVTLTALGGGGGASAGNGDNGGSGGGASGNSAPNTGGSSTQTSPTGATGYGNAGASTTTTFGGGGGGSGGTSGGSGAGGAGREFSTFSDYGVSGFFAGGGGGASLSSSGAAGSGGGGTGGRDGVAPTAGTANTGSGGGGVAYHDGGSAASGGSGVVLIAYDKSKPGSSSIYFDGTGDELEITTNSSDFNFETGNFTAEFWVRFNDITTNNQQFLFKRNSTYYGDYVLWWSSSNGMTFTSGSGGSGTDVNQGGTSGWANNTWYHVALVRNGTSLNVYRDGTSIVSATNSIDFDNTGNLHIGSSDGSGFFSGYMDEIRISNSARYTSSFTPSTTAFTADANTLLLIHSDFDGGLGADSSGNENDFAVTNLVATDQVLDSPTNNFCTWSPLWVPPVAPTARGKLSEGNLSISSPDTSSVSYNGATLGTIGVASGKWYFEYYAASANYPAIGIAKTDYNQNYATTNVGNRVWLDDGNLYGTGSTASGTTWTTGDIIGCAVDMDNGKMWFSKNGAFISSGDPAAGTNAQFTDLLSGSDMSSFVTPFWSDVNWGTTDSGVLNCGQDSSFAGAKTAQGNGGDGEDFYYTPPTGYKALNTDNLSAPAIALPTDHFNTVLVSGNSSARSITGLNFQPDLLWGKSRTNTLNHYLTDSVRGVNSQLYSDGTGTAGTETVIYTAFNSDGFNLGNGDMNTTGQSYANWCWKGGGAAVTKTAGNIDGTNPTIASSVSANPTAGFSIVNWNGTEASATIEHGLSQAPELIIVKDVDTARSWPVNIENITGTANEYLILDTTAAQATSTAYWGGTPGASVFTVGDSANTNDDASMIAYCFHSVEGYSKVGKYVGNGNADGSFVYTGFRPAYVMIKRYDSTSGANWILLDSKRDTFNAVEDSIYANLNNAEDDTDRLDFVSNGFKLRQNGTTVNTSSGNYIYLAIAESPFKTSNAR